MKWIGSMLVTGKQVRLVIKNFIFGQERNHRFGNSLRATLRSYGLLTVLVLSWPCHYTFADTYVTTEGNTIVITNQPSSKQRSEGRIINRKKRERYQATHHETCYLENRQTGEQTLKTNPSRKLLKTYRIIWCEEKVGSVTKRNEPKKNEITKKRSPKRKVKGGRSLPKRADKFKDFVSDAAQRYKLPEALLWAFMKVESDFIPTAVSRKGAQGLMQLMPLTAKDMGVTDAFDPRQNIYGAAKLISILMKRFNSEIPLVISAYHAGGGAVTRKEGIPYSETSQYMTSVLNAYYRFMEKPPYIK